MNVSGVFIASKYSLHPHEFAFYFVRTSNLNDVQEALLQRFLEISYSYNIRNLIGGIDMITIRLYPIFRCVKVTCGIHFVLSLIKGILS